MEHVCGTDGQTRTTHTAPMDKQHVRGTSERTGSICVPLMGRPGAHAWRCQVGMEHTCDTAGQTASTRVAPAASRHMRVSAGQSPSRSRRPGRAAPSHPPGARRGRPRLRPLGAGASGPCPDPPRSPCSGGARSRRGTAAAAGRAADAEGGERSEAPGPGSGLCLPLQGPAGPRLPRGRAWGGVRLSRSGGTSRSRSGQPRALRGDPGPRGGWRTPPSSPSHRRSRCPRGSSPALRRLGRCPPPPPPARPAAHVRPRPAGPLSGTGTGTRAHRHPLPRPGRSPPLSAIPYGAVWPGSGEAGGEEAAQPGERIPPEPGRGGAAAPGPGVGVGGERPVGGGEAALTGGIPLRGGGGRRGAEEAGTGGRAGGGREGGGRAGAACDPVTGAAAAAAGAAGTSLRSLSEPRCSPPPPRYSGRHPSCVSCSPLHPARRPRSPSRERRCPSARSGTGRGAGRRRCCYRRRYRRRRRSGDAEAAVTAAGEPPRGQRAGAAVPGLVPAHLRGLGQNQDGDPEQVPAHRRGAAGGNRLRRRLRRGGERQVPVLGPVQGLPPGKRHQGGDEDGSSGGICAGENGNG